AVAAKGAFRQVAKTSAPRFLVGARRFTIRYVSPRSTKTGWLIFEANSVVVTESGPSRRVTSMVALRPLSAASGTGSESRDRPADSVSSVSGVGAKNPCPADQRLVQPPHRI